MVLFLSPRKTATHVQSSSANTEVHKRYVKSRRLRTSRIVLCTVARLIDVDVEKPLGSALERSSAGKRSRGAPGFDGDLLCLLRSRATKCNGNA